MAISMKNKYVRYGCYAGSALVAGALFLGTFYVGRWSKSTPEPTSPRQAAPYDENIAVYTSGKEVIALKKEGTKNINSLEGLTKSNFAELTSENIVLNEGKPLIARKKEVANYSSLNVQPPYVTQTKFEEKINQINDSNKKIREAEENLSKNVTGYREAITGDMKRLQCSMDEILGKISAPKPVPAPAIIHEKITVSIEPPAEPIPMPRPINKDLKQARRLYDNNGKAYFLLEWVDGKQLFLNQLNNQNKGEGFDSGIARAYLPFCDYNNDGIEDLVIEWKDGDKMFLFGVDNLATRINPINRPALYLNK